MRLEVRGVYPADWPDISERVRAEAGNRCIRCGHPAGDSMGKGVRTYVACDARCTHKTTLRMRVLTVHHMDGDKANCVWWNLLALCQVCHLIIQARVIPTRPWILPHSAWFVPYVCGFYARYYGDVDITRAEAVADPDRWLAMGQPWLVKA